MPNCQTSLVCFPTSLFSLFGFRDLLGNPQAKCRMEGNPSIRKSLTFLWESQFLAFSPLLAPCGFGSLLIPSCLFPYLSSLYSFTPSLAPFCFPVFFQTLVGSNQFPWFDYSTTSNQSSVVGCICGCVFDFGKSKRDRLGPFWRGHTVDGPNAASVAMWFILLFAGFYSSQVVQDFVHPQYPTGQPLAGGLD